METELWHVFVLPYHCTENITENIKYGWCWQMWIATWKNSVAIFFKFFPHVLCSNLIMVCCLSVLWQYYVYVTAIRHLRVVKCLVRFLSKVASYLGFLLSGCDISLCFQSAISELPSASFSKSLGGTHRRMNGFTHWLVWHIIQSHFLMGACHLITTVPQNHTIFAGFHVS